MTNGARERTRRALELANSAGFDLVGVTSATPTDQLSAYGGWLARGFHGAMDYLAREDAVRRRGELSLTLAGVRSTLVVADEYLSRDAVEEQVPPHRGVVARYARGVDYHEALTQRLEGLLTALRAEWTDCEGRVYVDTGPILERDLARRGGLGWFGKNTMLINPLRGSYFFLGSILLNVEMEPSEPFEEVRCGSCRACLDACPTGALLGYDEKGAPVMDARRCISYLTIELRGSIPVELRPLIGNRVYGCDICQEVCPWNQTFARPRADSLYEPRGSLDGPELLDWTRSLLAMSGKAYQRTFKDSPLSRPRRNGMLRNLCVALGNWGSPEAVTTLGVAATDQSELVRGHAVWALGRIGAAEALEILREREEMELDVQVKREVESALAEARSSSL